MKILDSYKTISLLETYRDELTIGIDFNVLQNQDGIEISLNNVYEFIKTYGYTLKILSPLNADSQSWLNNTKLKYDELVFCDKEDIWKNVDILIENDTQIINSKPLSKVCVKVNTLDNESMINDINISSLKDLTINIIKKATSKIAKKRVS